MRTPTVWLVLSAAMALRPAVAPSVYWMSNPTLSNETLLVAGAGLQASLTSLTAGLTRIARLGPVLLTDNENERIPIRGLNVGHDLGQPCCAISFAEGRDRPALPRRGLHAEAVRARAGGGLGAVRAARAAGQDLAAALC